MGRKIAALLGALLCSGCAFQSQVDRATVDYNQAVASSTNDLTLLNVVRAMKRQPLHFTSLSKISGSFRVTGRAGLNTDIVESGGTDTLTPAGALASRTATIGPERFAPSAGAEVTAGPSFDIGILDTQEFYQGILRSVEPDVVGSFLQMGWPSDLLTALFVERIELHIPSGARNTRLEQELRPDPARWERPETVWILANDPDDPVSSPHFGQFLKCFRLRPAVAPAKATPLWPVKELGALKMSDLVLLDGQKLALSHPHGDEARMVERPGASAPTIGLLELKTEAEGACAFEFVRDDDNRLRRALSVDIYHKPQKQAELEALLPQEPHAGGHGMRVEVTRPGEQNLIKERDQVPATIHIVLRSAQAVIYYLGEYARGSLNGSGSPYRLPDGMNVIDVQKGRVPGAFATARLDGELFSIPNDSEGRSLATVALVQQILNLQKSAKDKPTTTSVRVVD